MKRFIVLFAIFATVSLALSEPLIQAVTRATEEYLLRNEKSIGKSSRFSLDRAGSMYADAMEVSAVLEFNSKAAVDADNFKLVIPTGPFTPFANPFVGYRSADKGVVYFPFDNDDGLLGEENAGLGATALALGRGWDRNELVSVFGDGSSESSKGTLSLPPVEVSAPLSLAFADDAGLGGTAPATPGTQLSLPNAFEDTSANPGALRKVSIEGTLPFTIQSPSFRLPGATLYTTALDHAAGTLNVTLYVNSTISVSSDARVSSEHRHRVRRTKGAEKGAFTLTPAGSPAMLDGTAKATTEEHPLVRGLVPRTFALPLSDPGVSAMLEHLSRNGALLSDKPHPKQRLHNFAVRASLVADTVLRVEERGGAVTEFKLKNLVTRDGKVRVLSHERLTPFALVSHAANATAEEISFLVKLTGQRTM